MDKQKYISLYIPVELRAKTYENLQSYRLDDSYGEFSGFYLTNPNRLITYNDTVQNSDKTQFRSADRLVCRENFTFTLKGKGTSMSIPAKDFATICRNALWGSSAASEEVAADVAEDESPFPAEIRAHLSGALEEDFYNDEDKGQQIVLNMSNGKYMVLSNADMDFRVGAEASSDLVISDEGLVNLAKAYEAGHPIFFDTVEDAKLEMYGANAALPATVKAEDAEYINNQYRDLVLQYSANGYEDLPTKQEFTAQYLREQNWLPYQNFKNDKAYEKSTPFALREKPIFVGWKFEYYDANGNPLQKPAKMPYNPRTGGRAMANMPATWAKFDVACEAVDKFGFNGIGIMFGKYSLLGVDIDHCIDKDGKISTMAGDIIDKLNTYTEYSPSGSGVHMLAFGDIERSRRLPELEIYKENRFFTLTGHLYEGKLRKIRSKEETQPAINEVWDKYVKPYITQTSSAREAGVSLASDAKQKYSDEEILRKIQHSERSRGKFERLCQGLPPFEWDDATRSYTDKVSAYWYRDDGNIDTSRIDSAFAKVLVYYNATPEQIDRIYRQQPLCRPKWDEKRGTLTYGQRVIENAFEASTKRYDGSFGTGKGQTKQSTNAQPVQLNAQPRSALASMVANMGTSSIPTGVNVAQSSNVNE